MSDSNRLHVINVCPWCRYESGPRGSTPWAVDSSKTIIVLSFVWCYNRPSTCAYQPSDAHTEEYTRLIQTRTHEVISSTYRYRQMLGGTYMGIPVSVMCRVKNISTGGFYCYDITGNVYMSDVDEALRNDTLTPYTP